MTVPASESGGGFARRRQLVVLLLVVVAAASAGQDGSGRTADARLRVGLLFRDWDRSIVANGGDELLAFDARLGWFGLRVGAGGRIVHTPESPEFDTRAVAVNVASTVRLASGQIWRFSWLASDLYLAVDLLGLAEQTWADGSLAYVSGGVGLGSELELFGHLVIGGELLYSLSWYWSGRAPSSPFDLELRPGLSFMYRL